MCKIVPMSDFIEIHSCSEEESIMSFPMGALSIKTSINVNPDVPKAILINHYTSEDPILAAQEVLQRKPLAVGLSIYIWNTNWFEKFAKEIKNNADNILIFAGGSQISSFENQFPDYINFAVLGEGEVTTIECLKQHFNGNTPNGLIKALVPDLNNVPSVFLTKEADSLLEKNSSVLWEMSRGCPFKCAFCYESRGIRTVRDFPLEKIKNELTYLINHEVDTVFVLDPTFNLNQDRAKEILNYLIDNAPSYMHFTFEVRAELIDEEMAKLFSILNCSLQIGLQTCDEEISKKINRNLDKELFTKKCQLLTKYGVAFGIDIIIGLPDDNLAGFRKTVNYVVSLMPSNIDCFLLSLLPGTDLAQISDSLGLVSGRDTLRTLKSSPTFSEEDIKTALKIKESMDMFYTKGQSDMWIHCILETLNITACNLFSLFSQWMEQTNRSYEEDIWILQDNFVTSLFEKTQNNKLIPAITSFMELHQGICYAIDTGESATLNLAYTVDDLSCLDKMSLSEFFKTKKSRRIQTTVTLDDSGSIVFV